MKRFSSFITEEPSDQPLGDIYCDMDGVLVDIIGGICKMDGVTRCTQKSFDKYIETHKKRFDADHPNLFQKLPWMKDGKRLWAYISNFGPHILSAHTSSWQPSSKEDKMVWIKANLKPLPHRIHILRRSEKQMFATKGDGIPNVLIDDWNKNIIEWKAKGGIGILHRNAETTIATLKNLGYTIKMKKPK